MLEAPSGSWREFELELAELSAAELVRLAALALEIGRRKAPEELRRGLGGALSLVRSVGKRLPG